MNNRRNFLKAISLGLIGSGFSHPLYSNPLKKAFPLSDFTENANIRNDFMLKNGLSYFNTGSLGPSPKKVFQKVSEITKVLEENPVGNNWGSLGKEADKVRTQIAQFINANDHDEIILTRNTTEGMNWITNGLQLKLKPNDEILTTTDEHYGGVAGWEFLEKYHQVKVKRIHFPKENLTTDQVLSIVKKNLSPRTKVCSFMDVSTITGMRLPLKEIAKITKPKGILLVVDGAQSAGMLKVDVKEMGVDVFTTSGHKWMLGPKETGFVYIKKEIQDQIKTVQLETGHKVYNHSTGTRNIANVIGLGEAIRIQETWGGITKIEQHNISLAKNLREQLKSIKNFKLITPEEDQLASGINSVIVQGKQVSDIYDQLNKKNIVVKKLGKRDILRFSTHIFNTQKEVDQLVLELSKIMK